MRATSGKVSPFASQRSIIATCQRKKTSSKAASPMVSRIATTGAELRAIQRSNSAASRPNSPDDSIS